MRHFDFIKNVNPDVVQNSNKHIRAIVAEVLGLSRTEALKTSSYAIGSFVHIRHDICVSGAWGKIVRNRKYPYWIQGHHRVEEPSEGEKNTDIVLTSGETYILLLDHRTGEYMLVRADHAFSAI